MSTLLSQMTDICVYLWDVAGQAEIHLPADVFDRLNQQMHPMLTVSTQRFTLLQDELGINGVIIKRKR